MILLLCLLILPPGPPQSAEPAHLLERAKTLREQIDKAAGEGRETRSLYRQLLDLCVQLRRAVPTSLPLCMNEGHAASLAGDWPHALLAYRLAQRLAPNDPAVAGRLTAVRGHLILPDQRPNVWDEVALVLSANGRLRASFWLVAVLLYGMAWVRIAGLAPRSTGSGSMLALLGMCAALAIATVVFWSENYRRQILAQKLAVIRRGDPVVVREGNGLSYPAATEERLRAGTDAIVLGQRGNWLHVRTTRGLVGWIPGGAADVE
jgi:hypothetical protein